MSGLAILVTLFPEDVDMYCDLTPIEEAGDAEMDSLDSLPRTRIWTRRMEACREVSSVAVRKQMFRFLFTNADLIRGQMRVITSLMNSVEFRPLSGQRYAAPHQLHDEIYASADALGRWYQDNASIITSAALADVRLNLGIAKGRNLLSDFGELPNEGTDHGNQVKDWGYVTLYYYQALMCTVHWITNRVQFVALDCQIFCRADTTDRIYSAA